MSKQTQCSPAYVLPRRAKALEEYDLCSSLSVIND